MTPAPRSPRRRNETRELVVPIMAAVNALPGVRVWRPHVLSRGSARDITGAGLANGSADLVGLCLLPDVCWPWTRRTGLSEGYVEDAGYVRPIGRWLSLEAKWPGEKPTADQRLWAEVVRKLGGFYAVVHSIEEALAAVERCREGADQ
jgi:hypothetical protein